jgi:hypothetical protein
VTAAAAAFLDQLRVLGLRRIERLVLTRNRRVLVSVRGARLRVHEAFASAEPERQRAIVRFLMAPTRAERLAARAELVSFPLPPAPERTRAPERTHPDDVGLAAQVASWHAELNAERFAGALGAVGFRVSRRMRRRLGHYAPGADGRANEIALSARHLRRDGLAAARATLLHEMVHQWQHERGLPLGHGAEFRRKCREVGAPSRAPRASSTARARALP